MSRYTFIYAVKYDHGKEISRTFVDSAIFDGNTISARKYNSLKRFVLGIPVKRNQYIRLETEDGRADRFGGYPAFTNVRFE